MILISVHFVRFIILLIPDVVDFILTILSYDYNCTTFFVLRFVTQGIIVFFVWLLLAILLI